MTRRPVLSRFLVVLGVVFVVAGASRAADDSERKPWVQADVAALARQVQHACSDLRNKERAQPPSGIASGQSHARERYMDKLFQAEGEARRLADQAEAGKSRDASYNVFQRLDELQRDAAEEARRMFLPKATIDELQSLRAAIEQLRLYYEGRIDTRPELVGPTKDD
jgi:hypothetical protein